jgi:acyl-CoA synthetase (AMP-forming)/AMP-acid ligase II
MVNWFPFFHIAGLGLLFQVLTPVDQHIVAMKYFLADPALWLRLVSETGASHAVSPSSIWSEVLESVAARPEGLDLSHLEQVAFNAELVDAGVVARLRDVCGPRGLHPGTIAVHYASSEAGMISHTPPGRDPRVDSVDLAELVRSGHALAARPGRRVKRVVSCGRPYPGCEVRVGAPDCALPDREVGAVWARGPGVTDGYVNVGDDEIFSGGWLRVGDLGYMEQGELFVTGRSDEVVVHFGEKYHPEDIERAVLQVTGLAPRACAAFANQDGQAGGFVVVVETDHRPDLPGRASAAIADAVGTAPSEVLVVPGGTVPTTPNGKLQRSKLRQMHARGELDRWRT